MKRFTPLALALVLTACPAGDDGTGTEETSGTTSDTMTETTDATDTMTETTGDETTGDPNAIDCEVDAWDIGADTQWKSAWMATCMVPAIAPIMQGIDPVKYENFSCTHCHGADLNGGTYAMPNAIMLDWAEAANWPPEYFDGNTFMGPMADVALTAADTLGYEVFDPNTQMGFGCAGCHPGL